jgi:hypothetical protein
MPEPKEETITPPLPPEEVVVMQPVEEPKPEPPPPPPPTRVKFQVDRDTQVTATVTAEYDGGTAADLLVGSGVNQRAYLGVGKAPDVTNMHHALPIGKWRPLRDKEV